MSFYNNNNNNNNNNTYVLVVNTETTKNYGFVMYKAVKSRKSLAVFLNLLLPSSG